MAIFPCTSVSKPTAVTGAGSRGFFLLLQLEKTAQEKSTNFGYACKDGNPNMVVLTARFNIHSTKSQMRIQKIENKKDRPIGTTV